MIVSVTHNDTLYQADLSTGVDLSIPISAGGKLSAYHAEPPRMEPFIMGNWVGEVSKGAAVNYRNIFFNPHGNGTHTECVGHIDRKIHSVNQCFKQFHVVAQLISVHPIEQENGDHVILDQCLPPLEGTEAVIVRTLPNSEEKRSCDYSGSNPPYLHHLAVKALVESGCRHLVLDLPSVDREEDGGALLGHRTFWNYPESPRADCTITELAFVPDHVDDGRYLLNLQVAPFENDAAPSRPVIYPLTAV